MCDSLCINESTTFKDGDLKLTTTGSLKVAKLYLGKTYNSLKLQKLRYLRYMFYIVHNQQILYMSALSDVVSYVTTAQSSSNYIDPPPNASNHVLYPQLFEEFKAFFLFNV
jgi:hypothetical protein